MPEHIKLKKISLKDDKQYSEAWLQQVIADDPSILGIGDIFLKDRERRQPRAGRLDLLLEDVDGDGRYEVEIQLGQCDESHIIRTWIVPVHSANSHLIGSGDCISKLNI